jgi:hypothetical protein
MARTRLVRAAQLEIPAGSCQRLGRTIWSYRLGLADICRLGLADLLQTRIDSEAMGRAKDSDARFILWTRIGRRPLPPHPPPEQQTVFAIRPAGHALLPRNFPRGTLSLSPSPPFSRVLDLFHMFNMKERDGWVGGRGADGKECVARGSRQSRLIASDHFRSRPTTTVTAVTSAHQGPRRSRGVTAVS